MKSNRLSSTWIQMGLECMIFKIVRRRYEDESVFFEQFTYWGTRSLLISIESKCTRRYETESHFSRGNYGFSHRLMSSGAWQLPRGQSISSSDARYLISIYWHSSLCPSHILHHLIDVDEVSTLLCAV
jgi:hypothetical protein